MIENSPSRSERLDVHAPSERPIESKGADVLGREAFVERLTRSLISTQTRKATGIVIGVTGSWGSGKTSILNLLLEHIKSKYEQAAIVRFNPWLISGRNDLVLEFIKELRSAVDESSQTAKQSKALAKTLADYGERLAPALDYVPHGKIVRAIFKSASTFFKDDVQLVSLRTKLTAELSGFPHPIVVMIDELDRVEDSEVRSVAQLVRSIADFPAVSYVVAYDSTRVAEALGDRDEKKGRAYLEKIVQLQIPLPIVMAEDLIGVLRAELGRLVELELPANFWTLPRYTEIEALLVTRLLSTLRDIKRLIGTYQAVYGFVRGEADWLDVFGYSALLTKAPATAEKIRLDPERVVDDPLSEVEHMRRAMGDKKAPDKFLDELIPEYENDPGLRSLLKLLFPHFGRRSPREYADPISNRRTLITVLRLGVLPGGWTRETVVALSKQPPKDIAKQLSEMIASDKVQVFFDRLSELYGPLQEFEHLNFWRGVSLLFRRDTPHVLIVRHGGTVWRINAFADLLLHWVGKRRDFVPLAVQIFQLLKAEGDIELLSHWLHSHAFVHGLYGRQKRGGNRWFLDGSQTQQETIELANRWRALHLAGGLLSLIWDLLATFVMQGAGVWDEVCRAQLEMELTMSASTLDDFTIMLMGPDYSTNRATVVQFVNLAHYLSLVRLRLLAKGEGAPDPIADVSLRRVVDEFGDETDELDGGGTEGEIG